LEEETIFVFFDQNIEISKSRRKDSIIGLLPFATGEKSAGCRKGKGLNKTSIRLDLSKHCIQTECRRLYDRAISLYFKTKDGPEKKQLENRIGLLQKALTELDFGFLRSRFHELSGNTSAVVDIVEDLEGKIEIIINGEPAYVFPSRL